jgi:hypothetical protein
MKQNHIIAALLLLCLTGTAQAQARVTPCNAATPNNAICVSWAAVATDTSGAAISGVTYRTERAASASGPYTTVQASSSATQFYATNLATGTYYFRVYANCAACTGESAPSNAVNGSATPSPVIPNAPVIIIAATIRADGPPTYRIIQSVNLKPNEVVFAAPASMRSLFVAR